MQRVFMLSVSIAVVTWAASAIADSPNLMGDYGFTRTVRCIVSEFVFDDNFQPTGPAFGESFAEEGVRTFYGDGTGTTRFKALNITTPPAMHPGAFTSEVPDQKFSYSIDGDGKWSIPGGGSITGTVGPTGPKANDKFTISDIAPVVGHISKDSATLTLSTVTPPTTANSETIQYTTPSGADDGTLYRICNRSSVLISLPPGQ